MREKTRTYNQKEFDKMAGIETKLQKNMHLLSQDEGRYLPTEFRVSELVSCPAKAYYYRKTGKRPELNGKMFSGLLFHDKLPLLTKNIPAFKDAVFEKECRRTHTKFSIAGHADVITKDDVWEFKYSAAKVKQYPLPAHWLLQANAYATMLRRKYWNIVVVDSFSLAVHVKRGRQSGEGYDILVCRAMDILKALEENKPPKGPAEAWECMYCNLQRECIHYQTKKKENV